MLGRGANLRSARNADTMYSFLAVVFLIIVMIPIIWTFISSLKQRVDVFSDVPVLLFKPTFHNYLNLLLGDNPAYRYFANSLIITGGVVALAVTFGLMTAYGLTRFQVRAEKNILFFFLSLRMAPPISIALPLYLFFNKLGLIDTYLGLVLAHSTFTLPFAIWMLTSYLREIPTELEEAAFIDGCSRFACFRKIVLPLAVPGVATTALFTVMLSWTEFLFALILTQTHAKTVTVAITESWGGIVVDWGMLSSFSIVAMVPVIVIAFVVQRHLIRGLTLGALK